MESLYLDRPMNTLAALVHGANTPAGPRDYIREARAANGEPVEPVAPGEFDPRD
jgi:hypothetical protein